MDKYIDKLTNWFIVFAILYFGGHFILAFLRGAL